MISMAIASSFMSSGLFAQAKISTGKGNFIFRDQKGDKSKSIKVYYYAPKKLNANSRIVFVLHGIARSGVSYRDRWIKHADKYNFLVLCPEFSEQDYPGFWGYHFGNMYDSKEKMFIEKNKWGFSVIERLFDYVKESAELRIENYCIFGHSAGAQFVHRMIIFLPEARTSLAIAANAGCYTMPDFDTTFCFGLKNTAVTKESLKKAFKKNLIIMLGKKDIIPRDETESERKQGKHRLEKGFNFLKMSKAQAESMNAQLNWRTKTIAGAGHNSPKLSEAASRLFAKSRKKLPTRQVKNSQ